MSNQLLVRLEEKINQALEMIDSLKTELEEAQQNLGDSQQNLAAVQEDLAESQQNNAALKIENSELQNRQTQWENSLGTLLKKLSNAELGQSSHNHTKHLEPMDA